MKPNLNPNFLDSATNYWASKLKFMQKSNENPEPQLPPSNNTYLAPPSNPSFYSPNVYSQNQVLPQMMSQIPYGQANFYVPNNGNYTPIGRFQNLVPSQIYANNVKMMPSAMEGQNNFYPPSPQYFYPYQNHNENVFGSVLKKANSFWQCSPQSTQSHFIQRPQFFCPQGFHSDPLSREITSSNKESEFFSWEASFNKDEDTNNKMTQPLVQKKIKKKNYRKNKKGKNQGSSNTKSGDSVSIAKKLLAIAKNWQEVCQKIPLNMQTIFKEKMKRYLKKKILPDLQLKNKLQKFIHHKDPSLENEINPHENENISTNNNFDEVKGKNENTELHKFDEIFGKDLEKLLQRNEANPNLKEEFVGLDWQTNGELNHQFELESPTLSKILKQDVLSINYEFKEKEFGNENEMKNIFFEKNDQIHEDEMNLIDSMINENENEKKETINKEMG